MKLPAYACAALLASVAVPVAAQDSAPVAPGPAAAPSAAIDPAAMEAARSLLKASGFETQMEQIARQNSAATFDTMMTALAREGGTPLPEDLKASVRAIILQDVEGMIAEMKLTALDQAAAVYARYFTAEELRELERLQTNPILVKFQRIAPEFMTELSQIGVAVAAARLPAMRTKLRAAVDEWARKQAPRRRDRRGT